MRTDTFLYDFFVHKPAELARLLGLDPSYSWTFDSVAAKRVERTIDGKLFCAERQEGPVFVELQGYRDSRIYWRLYNEVTTWWMGRPESEVAGKSFMVFVVFLDDGHDPKNSPMSPLPPHSLVTMTLKEALTRLTDQGLLLVLEPLVLKDLAELEARLPHYRELIQQLPGTEEQRTFIQGLLVHAIITRFPNLKKEEVKKMLNLIPLRETRFYQDVSEENKQEGWKQGREEGRMEGRMETFHTQLLKLWSLRFGPPVDWVTLRITQCQSLPLLETLFEQVALASSAEDAQAHVKLALGNGA